MKRRAVQVDRGAVAEAADDVRMAHAIKGHRFVLKICDQGAFEIAVRFFLQEKIERFDYNNLGAAFRGRVVVSLVALRVAAAAQALKNVVAAIKSALLEFELRHY